jgi:hypothetical protein
VQSAQVIVFLTQFFILAQGLLVHGKAHRFKLDDISVIRRRVDGQEAGGRPCLLQTGRTAQIVRTTGGNKQKNKNGRVRPIGGEREREKRGGEVS